MRKKAAICLSVILLVTLFYVLRVNDGMKDSITSAEKKPEKKTLHNTFKEKIKSGNLSTDYDIDIALNDIEKLGLNTLNIPVAINIGSLTASDMTIDKVSEEKAKKLLEKLKGKNIHVILEPYPWIENGSKYETEWHPQNVEDFFNNWKTKVLKPLIDEIAIPYDVDVLNIGTSFTKIEYEEARFCDMVDYVRRYFNGLVTYRTSWWVTVDWNDKATKELQDKLKSEYEKKLNNKLFSKIDFISIATYFELTDNDTNTVDNLVKAIDSTQRFNRKQNVKQEIKNFYEIWKKPIFFGELGFPRTDKASIEPWNPFQTEKVNGKEQANCFEAYRTIFEDEPWHLGFSIFAIGNKDADKWYYPSEETVKVIKGWYAEESS